MAKQGKRKPYETGTPSYLIKSLKTRIVNTEAVLAKKQAYLTKLKAILAAIEEVNK
jgi:hypothetical protein